jgi:chemotaxis signal transduction protein
MAATSIIPPVGADEPPVGTVSYEPPAASAGKYLTFRVARRDFAMSAEHVRGILPVHEMAALNARHGWIIGFAAVGGRDFPVVDLAAKLAIPNGSRGREPFIIVVATGEKLVGFIADRVSDLLDVRARDFRNGALRGHGRPRRLLDPEQIMTEEQWSALRLIPSL